MNRRTFVKTSTLGAVALVTSCQADQTAGFIDTHTHFYDPTRPEGVPWPNKKSPLYRKVLPKDFLEVASPFGVTKTVVVEASNRLEDNQWILDLAKENESIVGFVGNVDPTIDNWKTHISRFAKDKNFKGIRLKKSINKLSDSSIINSFKLMKDLNLCLDLNGGVKALNAAVEISKNIPDMRLVVEHLPGRESFEPSAAFKEALLQVKELPNVYVKISSVLVKVAGKFITDPAKYTKSLDLLWNTFGEDRVIYGSNWPVSDLYNGEYKDVFNVVNTYFSEKGVDTRNKYFYKNAIKAYRLFKN